MVAAASASSKRIFLRLAIRPNCGMTVLFADDVPVHYGFMFLSPSTAGELDLSEARRGQVNGLCGAAVPGVLSLVTGLHTGDGAGCCCPPSRPTPS
jgi:hypothetical protein